MQKVKMLVGWVGGDCMVWGLEAMSRYSYYGGNYDYMKHDVSGEHIVGCAFFSLVALCKGWLFDSFPELRIGWFFLFSGRVGCGWHATICQISNSSILPI